MQDNKVRTAAPGVTTGPITGPITGPWLALRHLVAALAVLLAGPAIFALFGTPTGNSYGFNIAWAAAFEAAQASGSFYPRHLPALLFGLGGLDFYFYAPLPFFMAAGPAAALCPGCAVQTVFALSGGLWWSLSLLTFWPLARRFAPPRAALAGCLVYGLLGYHLAIDWVARQAAGEFAAYALLPLLALGLHDALHRGRAGLAFPLGLAGVILCHLPTALLAAHVFGMIALVWAVGHPRLAPARLGWLVIMALAGVALAALYWLPALALLDDVSPEALQTAALSPEAWLFFGPEPLPGGRLGALIALAALGACAAAVLALMSGPAETRGRAALWIALPIGVCVVLNTAATEALWSHWVIGRVQFPFRLMVFVDLAAALAAARLATGLAPGTGKWRRLAAGSGLIALLVPGAVGLVLGAGRITEGTLLIGDSPRMIAPAEYLPPPFFAEVHRRAAAEGLEAWQYPGLIERSLTEIRAGTLPPDLPARAGRWQLTLPTEDSPVTLAVPYWQHMRAQTAQGRPVTIRPSTHWGLVEIDVPPGAPVIEITLARHWSQTLGAALSVLGLLGCAGIVIARPGRQGRPAETTPRTPTRAQDGPARSDDPLTQGQTP